MTCPHSLKSLRAYFGSGVVDDLLRGQVAFVAHQELVDVLAGVAVNLLEPLLHVVERLLVSAIVDDDDPVSTAIVRGSDGPETLLPGSVPLERETNEKSVEMGKHLDRGSR